MVLDGAEVPPEQRQGVAADLGLSETVFVDDRERGELRIFTPAVELDFAGHPTVGAAWLLEDVEALRTQAGIAQYEATGSAATRLAEQLGRPIDIRQGRGSRICARPRADALVEIGGLCAADEARDHAVAPLEARPPGAGERRHLRAGIVLPKGSI